MSALRAAVYVFGISLMIYIPLSTPLWIEHYYDWKKSQRKKIEKQQLALAWEKHWGQEKTIKNVV